MANNQQEIKHVFHVADDGCISAHRAVPGAALHEIPPGVYTLVFESSPLGGGRVYLRPENNFKLPKRLYGNVTLNVERFLKSYELNDKNLGTLFIGEQGSGKTLLLKALAVKAVELGFPVILVDEALPGPMLNYVMSTITQPTLVCFDEFEKTYKDLDDQKDILRLLDGTNTGAKKMYCLSANRMDKISPHLLNRSSRIRYVMRFDRLDVATVVDYVQTNLKDCKEEDLRAFIHLALCDSNDQDSKESRGMNFDCMTEYVKEMNQFGDSLNEVLALMNVNGQESWARFDMVGFKGDQRVSRHLGSGSHIGAYADRDTWNISYTVHVPRTPEEIQKDGPGTNPVVKTLSRENFKGYGDSYESLVYEQDGIEFHLRYVDTKAARVVEKEVATENRGKLKTLQQLAQIGAGMPPITPLVTLTRQHMHPNYGNSTPSYPRPTIEGGSFRPATLERGDGASSGGDGSGVASEGERFLVKTPHGTMEMQQGLPINPPNTGTEG